jgi:hypothetical protein
MAVLGGRTTMAWMEITSALAKRGDSELKVQSYVPHPTRVFFVSFSVIPTSHAQEKESAVSGGRAR